MKAMSAKRFEEIMDCSDFSDETNESIGEALEQREALLAAAKAVLPYIGPSNGTWAALHEAIARCES